MESRDIGESKDQEAKLIKITTIVPFRLIKSTIIEDINESILS